MREVKCRGYNKKHDGWVTGSYVDGHIVNEVMESNEKYISIGKWAQVDIKSVGQYTGLKDKNGVEICKGDVLKGHDNPVDLVQVSFGEFGVVDMESETIIDTVIGWHTKVIPTDAISQAHPFCLDMPLTKRHIIDCEWEIIGNAYENKELLAGRGNDNDNN